MIGGHKIQTARVQHEEAAVDESALDPWLLLEGDDLAALHDDPPEARRGTHAGDRRLQAVFRVKGDFGADIDV